MSLIFKALKKLKDQPAAVVSQDQPAKKERYIYSFRKIILSPLLVTALALLLVVIGFGLFYTVGYIQQQPVPPPLPAKLPPHRVAEAGPPQHAAEGTYIAKEMPSKSASVDVPPAPKDFDAGGPSTSGQQKTLSPADQAAQPGKAGGTRNGREGQAQSPQTASRFLPRETAAPRVATQASQERQAAKKEQPWSGSTGLPKEQQVSTEAASDRVAKTQIDTPEASSLTSTAAIKFKPGAPTVETHSKAAAKAGQRPGHQKVLRTKMTQQARIARLVARIQTHMNLHEEEETKRLIDELETLKGSENAYVLKLKAYWHLRHDDFDAATLLLNKVLQNDAEDLEAGINMAVTEMKTNQLAAAQQRLAKLRDIYPDNTLIPELLHMLR